VPRLPLVSGSRTLVVNAPEDAVVLRPPAPREGIADVAAAVRDALRFPLSGPPLEALAAPGGRATVVVQPPALPFPGAQHDPRRDALAAALDELRRVGIPDERTTIVVATGLGRRAGQRELEALLAPPRARAFHGRVEVHDCEGDLVAVGEADGLPLRVHRALVETDVVVTVTAAETVVDGGAGALLAACGTEPLRAADADSLLETAGSRGWQLGLAVERALAARVPLVGASLVLNHPRTTGPYRGYPFERSSYAALVRSPLRRLLNAMPASVRQATLEGLPRELTTVAAFGGQPSVAHAEALLRGLELRGTRLDRPLDAIVVPIPWSSHHVPRETLNPVTVAAFGLALALRLRRDGFPVVPGGTAVLVHGLSRRFEPATAPYRELLAAARDGELRAAEEHAARDPRALEAYRRGRACHPLLPYREWASCRRVIDRLGAIVIAGCRDAQAARSLGFVPTHGMAAALTMARGRAGTEPRIGFLVAPPYPPILVGDDRDD
jgi:hypothetical protein